MIQVVISGGFNEMAMTVWKRCGGCKTTYKTGVDERGIGRPFIVCEGCNSYIVDKDNNEWELMTSFGKFKYLLIGLWTAFLFGFALPFLVHLLDSQINTNYAEDHIVILWLLGSAGIAYILSKDLREDIAASKVRMTDPEYRATLRRLGLLKVL